MDEIENARLTDRIAARKSAEELLGLIREMAAEVPPHCIDVFMRVFRDEFSQQSPPSVLQPMTNAQAALFRRLEMPFGMYAGRPIARVPLPYLDWLAGQEDDFKIQVRQYLANEKIKELLRKELDRKP